MLYGRAQISHSFASLSQIWAPTFPMVFSSLIFNRVFISSWQIMMDRGWFLWALVDVSASGSGWKSGVAAKFLRPAHAAILARKMSNKYSRKIGNESASQFFSTYIFLRCSEVWVIFRFQNDFLCISLTLSKCFVEEIFASCMSGRVLLCIASPGVRSQFRGLPSVGCLGETPIFGSLEPHKCEQEEQH